MYNELLSITVYNVSLLTFRQGFEPLSSDYCVPRPITPLLFFVSRVFSFFPVFLSYVFFQLYIFFENFAFNC